MKPQAGKGYRLLRVGEMTPTSGDTRWHDMISSCGWHSPQKESSKYTESIRDFGVYYRVKDSQSLWGRIVKQAREIYTKGIKVPAKKGK